MVAHRLANASARCRAIAAGDHATTFGANPVACAAAVVVFNKLVEDGFVNR